MGKRSKIAAIDLFCGTGGLSLGLKQGGIRVVAGIDNASACSYPYSHNIKAKFIERSVCDVTGEDLKRLWGASGCSSLGRLCALSAFFLAATWRGHIP